jgi:hypothetical protein
MATIRHRAAAVTWAKHREVVLEDPSGSLDPPVPVTTEPSPLQKADLDDDPLVRDSELRGGVVEGISWPRCGL